MKGSEDSPSHALNSVIEQMQLQLESLYRAKADLELVRAYKLVLKYLRNLPVEQAARILGQKNEGKIRKRAMVPLAEIGDAELEKLSLDEVRSTVAAHADSRALLERIGRVRFGMTAGALSALKNKSALLERIAALASNEGTHFSIARIALGRSKKEQ